MRRAQSCTVTTSLEGLTGSGPSGSSEDRGTDGRGKGIPSGIRIESNVIRQAANGIRIDAGEDLSMVENVIDGIDGAEQRMADGIKVSRVEQRSNGPNKGK